MGGYLLHLFGLLFWSLFFLAGFGKVFCSSNTSDGVIKGSVVVNGNTPIAMTDDNFVCATMDWWPPEKCDYGTCSWGLASLLNLNLASPILLNAVKAFSPLKIRLGGTLQDKVIYDTGDPGQPCTQFVKNESELFGFTQGCLPMWRWDELNYFFKKAGALITFGLNALNGRVSMLDGSLGGPWNSTNAAALIRYTVNKGYTIHGWELGNELCGNGVGTRVGSDQYAADVISLAEIVDNIYKGFSENPHQDSPTKPLVLAPGGFFDVNWFTELIKKVKPNSLDAVTHHIYNLGPGVDEHLIERILDPLYLDRMKSTFSGLEGILKSAGTRATAWVGESGGAYNSGRNLVTNAFVFSFWYLDQMGMSATYDTKTYCRQSLIGGNYGLLNTTTYKPNPDYYSALLWHRLMGTKVLSTTFDGTNKIRAYAHCARESEGITLLLINLDGNTTTEVIVSSKSAFIRSLKAHDSRGSRINFKHLPRARKISGFTREEYHLTAPNGNLHSQIMLLNGNILAMDQNGEIPSLYPIKVDASESIRVAPYSIVFTHIPYFYAPACR